MLSLLRCYILLLAFVVTASAQFQFFDNFFGGQQQQQQQQQRRENVASDSKWYRQTWQQAYCSDYLCPDTLACVAFPHHCPCAFPDLEEKMELADGKAICASKGGFKEGETIRKIELARKGLL